jgi:hypothetical protein
MSNDDANNDDDNDIGPIQIYFSPTPTQGVSAARPAQSGLEGKFFCRNTKFFCCVEATERSINLVSDL